MVLFFPFLGSEFCSFGSVQDRSLDLHTLSHHYYHTALRSKVFYHQLGLGHLLTEIFVDPPSSS
jgi:hypothetical protein